MSQPLPLQFPEPLINSVNKKQEIIEMPQIQIIKYMGNKRNLLQWLIPLINDHLEKGDTVLDLFAGTSSVGYALKPKTRIIANDIQEYSAVISRALLNSIDDPGEKEFESRLESNYNRNRKELLKVFSVVVKEERNQLEINDNGRYQSFINDVPRYGFASLSDRYKIKHYFSEKFINKRRKNKRSFPYLLFTTYYSNSFFSFEQSIDIDSLRFAIDQIKDKNKQAVYLSCLMSALSKSVGSSGHFAEYLNPTSLGTSKYVIGQRKRSILKHFLSKLEEFKDLYRSEEWENKVYNKDYKDLVRLLINNGEISNIKLVYIDTPYTSSQYSRYYHIPETLVKYDYPQISIDKRTNRIVKGGYRNDRHQSKYSHSSEVEQAFYDLFKIMSSSTNATLAVSYSDNSLIKPVEKLIKIANHFYKTVEKKNGYLHSAQGSRFKGNGQGQHLVNEYLLICKRK